jgi:hypothetical protein
MDISRITKNPGILSARLTQLDDPNACVKEPCSVELSRALQLGETAVRTLGKCRLTYKTEAGEVTVVGELIGSVVVVVALQTGHPIAKSLRRLMRAAVGVKRGQPDPVKDFADATPFAEDDVREALPETAA